MKQTRLGSIQLAMHWLCSCLAIERFDAAVEQDLAESKREGMTGTPAFYINGGVNVIAR